MMIKVSSQKILSYIGRNLILCIAMNSLLLFCACSYALSEELRTGSEKVTLRGRLTVEAFLNANDRPEDQFILVLEKPIDVAESEFGGPDKGVTKVQLIIFSGTEAWKKAPTLVNKNVKILGALFHSHTAHHHTKVLIEVFEINEINEMK